MDSDDLDIYEDLDTFQKEEEKVRNILCFSLPFT